MPHGKRRQRRGRPCALLAVLTLPLSSARPHNSAVEHLAKQTIDFGEHITRYILNVGSHNEPPDPTDAETAVVAVEPLPEVAAKIPVMDNRLVLCAAVGTQGGLGLLRHFLDSSSLLDNNPDPAANDWRYKVVAAKGRQGVKTLVPLLPLRYLLQSFSSAKCWFLKTDMQGFDFQAVQSAGSSLQMCSWVHAEVYCHGQTSYIGAKNDFAEHWQPHMQKLGFELHGGDPCWEGRKTETNALYRNTGPEHANIAKPDPVACPFCYA